MKNGASRTKWISGAAGGGALLALCCGGVPLVIGLVAVVGTAAVLGGVAAFAGALALAVALIAARRALLRRRAAACRVPDPRPSLLASEENGRSPVADGRTPVSIRARD